MLIDQALLSFRLINRFPAGKASHDKKSCIWNGIYVSFRGGSRIFFRRGCTRLLLYFNTNKSHRIPVVLENRRSSRGGGGGAHPLYPPPRSAPEFTIRTNNIAPLHSRDYLITTGTSDGHLTHHQGSQDSHTIHAI